MRAYTSFRDIASPDGDMYSVAVFFHSGREPIFYYLPGDINEMHLGRDDAGWFLEKFIQDAWTEEEMRGTEMLVCPEGKIDRLPTSGYSRFAPFCIIALHYILRPLEDEKTREIEGSPTTKRI